jgi:hypothetical protein
MYRRTPGRNEYLSFREQFQLLRDVVRWFLGEAAEPVDQALDSVLDGDGGLAVAPREFLAGDTFDFGLGQQLAFSWREPPSALAAVEKLPKQNYGLEMVFGSFRVEGRGRRSARFNSECESGFANRPAKCSTAHFSCNRERKM